MSCLHPPVGATRSRKRRGRGQGSGLGCTSGRGNNGQKSRSGGSVRLGFEGGQMPLYRRLARRGFSNSPFKRKVHILNLAIINEYYQSGEILSMETLIQKGLVPQRMKNIKILGKVKIIHSITVKNDITLSVGASTSIEKAGGSVQSPAEVEAAGIPMTISESESESKLTEQFGEREEDHGK